MPRVIASVGHKLGGGGQGTTAAGTFGEPLEAGVIKALYSWSCSEHYSNNPTIKTCPFMIVSKTTYRISKHTPILGKKPALLRLRRLINDVVFDLWVSRQIAHFPEPIDIFHGWGTQSLFSIRAAKRKNAEIVLEYTSSHPEYAKNHLSAHSRIFIDSILRRARQEFTEADCIIVPSDFASNTFQAAGIASEKIRVIPYGIDHSIFEFTSRDKTDCDEFSVLFVGTVTQRKGCKVLIEAFAQADIPHSRLDFVGSVQGDMKSTVGKFSKHPAIHFHGHCDPIPFYRTSTVFVLPSELEGSALVCYEAAACSLPIITTHETGSIIRDGIDGFIVPVNSVAALAQKLRVLADNRHLVQAMSRSIVNHVSQFSWERRGKRMIELYSNLC